MSAAVIGYSSSAPRGVLSLAPEEVVEAAAEGVDVGGLVIPAGLSLRYRITTGTWFFASPLSPDPIGHVSPAEQAAADRVARYWRLRGEAEIAAGNAAVLLREAAQRLEGRVQLLRSLSESVSDEHAPALRAATIAAREEVRTITRLAESLERAARS